MGSFSEGVTVTCGEDGVTPEVVMYRGQEFFVCQPPFRWWERRPWWAEDARVPAGVDIRVDYARWRVQVRAGTRGKSAAETGPLWRRRSVDGAAGQRGASESIPATSGAEALAEPEPLTLDLMHNVRADRWRLIMVHDAIRLRYEALDESVDVCAEVLYADFSA